jgi:fructose-1,6-bisphosphatase/inositol monophosphatase family enzyme
MVGYMEQVFLPPDLRPGLATKAIALAHVTTLRCSAHQYRMVGQGAVDFNLAAKLSPWDHLAGSLIVRQAGGHVAMLDGRPYDASCDTGYLLAASSRQVWERLREHLAEVLL